MLGSEKNQHIESAVALQQSELPLRVYRRWEDELYKSNK